ncbi:hypothetical protein Cph01nite_05370 [Cellulomonas phragmiteti]|uniref:Uncharacterized protein n=1 Tax=Cellulomonas phragmiteti TaxID=478780 RepID=A0ABQ4DHF4_9CELL|nr:hypothetical protein Cph01nite_05370 [Cellulomonas phragmiteti]
MVAGAVPAVAPDPVGALADAVVVVRSPAGRAPVSCRPLIGFPPFVVASHDAIGICSVRPERLRRKP